jgi:hypothetical protein
LLFEPFFTRAGSNPAFGTNLHSSSQAQTPDFGVTADVSALCEFGLTPSSFFRLLGPNG